MRSLLDVNFLVALLDSEHEHHTRARTWLGQNGAEGWASCPITENGCIRILSQRAYPGGGCKPEEAMALLENLIQLGHHEFWPDDLSLLDRMSVDRAHLQGPRQLTDVYLLALAIKHGGRLASFDAGIPLLAAKGAGSEHIILI